MSNEINMSPMLTQMRLMSQAAQFRPENPLKIVNEGLPQAQQTLNFSDLMASAIKQVNNIQQQAGDLATDFASGKEGVDLTQVILAAEKSSVTFSAMVEIRNKLLKAYEEVKNISV